jgi:hypothetical protein
VAFIFLLVLPPQNKLGWLLNDRFAIPTYRQQATNKHEEEVVIIKGVFVSFTGLGLTEGLFEHWSPAPSFAS